MEPGSSSGEPGPGLLPVSGAPTSAAPAGRAGALTRSASRALEDAIAELDRVRATPLVAPRGGVFSRYLYGAWLPVAILGACLAMPEVRRRYLRITVTQAVVTWAVGVGVFLAGADLSRIADASLSTGAGRVFALVSSLLATVAVVEWLVTWLSRQYHDQLGRAASLLIGCPPEDPPLEPRVSLDLGWAYRKGARRLRGLRVWVVGIPGLALLQVVPTIGAVLYAVALFTWTAYWMSVFATAKTRYAWRTEGAEAAPEPWFARGPARFVAEVPGFRWWLPRLYVRLVRWFTRALYPPARELEARPAELAGIATLRALAFVPGLYLLVRPVLPVAAAHVVAGSDGGASAPAADRLHSPPWLGVSSSASSASSSSPPCSPSPPPPGPERS
jgi:hypothetical protein